jgi:hypothetical protein
MMQSYDQHPHHPEVIMMRLFPLTWAALNIGVAGAATYLLVWTDVLADAAIFLIH